VLQELEMQTRMELIPADWDDTGFLMDAAG
jgi:hypothetical protein